MYYIALIVVAILGIWMLGSYLAVRNIEEPAYTVVEKRSGYEIRAYAPYIIAETQVSGTYAQALGGGFRVIADYIFGNNTTKESISMTAPVLERRSEKIAMTVPVTTELGSDTSRTVSFVLPSTYTMDTLPTPNNEAVTLTKVPAQTVAALRFSGYATEQRVAKKKELLLARLATDNVTIIGTEQVAQYNPPLSMPLLRRNEILIQIGGPENQ